MKRAQKTNLAQAGFTLIEVLSVLVIIGLMSSAVVLSMPTPKPALITQSDDVLMQMNRAAQISLISGESYAFGASQEDYQIYRFTDTLWESELTTPWDKDIRLALDIEGQSLDIAEENVPIIIFEPTGLSTPFNLQLLANGQSVTLSSDGSGRVIIGAPS